MRLRAVIRHHANAALELLYPRNCQICFAAMEPVEGIGYVCGACVKTIRPIRAPFCQRCGLPFFGEITTTFECDNCVNKQFVFERAIAAVTTQGVLRDCVHQFKYQRRLWHGPVLAHFLVQAGLEHFQWEEVDGIVPVPLHPRKRREREFNQAEYLADALGRSFQKPSLKKMLRRVRDTATQTRLDASERVENMKGAFAVREKAAYRGKSFVLVDDVFTTGATTNECARILIDAGAKSVSVLTVARQVTRDLLGKASDEVPYPFNRLTP